MKRLAKNSPSTGPFVSVNSSNSRRVHSQGRARRNLLLGKQNLPANESINRVENLDEEIEGLMNVPVEETHTITKVKFNV